jgi:hypothetical protein
MTCVTYLYFIVMKKLLHFRLKAQLVDLIESYFEKALSQAKSKDKMHEPPTITGLALYIGFKSKEDFELYEHKGKFGGTITQARLG